MLISNTRSKKEIKKTRLDLVGISEGFIPIKSNFNNIVRWFYKKNNENICDYTIFLNSCKGELVDILKSVVLPIKINLKLEATYNKPHVENSTVDRAFKTSARAIFESELDELDDILGEEFTKLLEEEDEYKGKGSGFSILKIDGMLLGVYKYKPLG